MATSPRNERRIIVIGKSGNGKSSTGNTLLGYKAFKTDRSLSGVTDKCWKGEAINYDFKLRYTIIDTPGLLDADTKLATRALEIQRSLEICPEPHAFLLVFNGVIRFTEDDNITMKLMRVIFGKDVFKHCIIVFSRGEEFDSESDFKKFLTTSPKFTKLAERCGNRVTRIENKQKINDNQNIGSVDHILAMIEDLCNHGKETYSNYWISSCKKALSEHLETSDGKGDFHDELKALSRRIKTMDNTYIWKQRLGGVAVGAGAIGLSVLAGSVVLGPGAALQGAVNLGGTVVKAAWLSGARPL